MTMDEEKRRMMQDLIRQIQERSVELADLEVILEDYQHERRELLRAISNLKAALWEINGGAQTPAQLKRSSVGSEQAISED